jgi:hypothetical protein
MLLRRSCRDLVSYDHSSITAILTTDLTFEFLTLLV